MIELGLNMIELGLNMIEFYHCSSYYGDSEDEIFLEFKVDYTF